MCCVCIRALKMTSSTHEYADQCAFGTAFGNEESTCAVDSRGHKSFCKIRVQIPQSRVNLPS